LGAKRELAGVALVAHGNDQQDESGAQDEGDRAAEQEHATGQALGQSFPHGA
jgi:hypothetical protein